MSNWTWKQSVADCILEIVNSNMSARFSLADLYRYEPQFAVNFPANDNIRPKIRQTLQRLRDIGFVQFLEGGTYEVNTAFSEIEIEPVAMPSEPGIIIPQTKKVVRVIRLRNSLLSADMKRRYVDVCQLCRQALRLAQGTYSEAHHVKPLGSPHFGSDTEDNILVLCPNHHVMFDRGAVAFEPSTMTISHRANAFAPLQLLFVEGHQLNMEYVCYYQSVICNAC